MSDGLDNVLQFIFATTKGAFFVPRRNGEIERKNEGRGSGVEGGNRVSWLEGRGEMHNTSSQSALFHSSLDTHASLVTSSQEVTEEERGSRVGCRGGRSLDTFVSLDTYSYFILTKLTSKRCCSTAW